MYYFADELAKNLVAPGLTVRPQEIWEFSEISTFGLQFFWLKGLHIMSAFTPYSMSLHLGGTLYMNSPT